MPTRRHTKKPLVSVLMGTFNCPTYLKEAIRSVQGQTLKEFELIIVDESNDGVTREILRRVARKDPRIIVREESGLGLNKSLNLALKLARGTYIARMDGDDISMPSRFAKQVRFLKTHPEVGIVGTWAYRIDKDGKRTGELRSPVTHEVALASIMKTPPFIHPSVMARRSVMMPYNPVYRRSEDYDLWSRMIRTTRFANIPQFLMRYRQDFSTQVSITQGKASEWAAIKVRASLLRCGTVPAWHVVHLVRPLAMLLVPMGVKVWLMKKLRGRK